MAQVLHTCANLEADLQRQARGGEAVMAPATEAFPGWKFFPVSYGHLARKIPLL